MKLRAVVSFCFLAIFLAGCRVTPPGKWETSIMTRIKHSVTVRGKHARNPLPVSPTTIEDGRVAFSHYCVACHGLDAQNTGVPFADRMSPPVPSLESRTVQSYTDGQLMWILENGVSPSGMPASQGILTEKEMWSIIVFLRNLPQAGSLGEPPVYSGEDFSAPCTTPAPHPR
jgi:cytochrome c